jgi:hypothetical protein
MDNKPIAVTGLALMLAAVGAMCLLLVVGALPMTMDGNGSSGLALLFGVTGLACFVLAYGLFALKSWAWPLGIAMAVASVVVAILSMISRASFAGLVVSLMPALFLLGGLFLPDVRNALGRPRTPEPASTSAVSSPDSKINRPSSEASKPHKEHKTGRRK